MAVEADAARKWAARRQADLSPILDDRAEQVLMHEKWHSALKKAQDNEKRLVKKCRLLNEELKEDQAAILNLQKDMVMAWALVESSHDNDPRAMEDVQKLRAEIAHLSHKIEYEADRRGEEEIAVARLESQHDAFLQQRNQLQSQWRKDVAKVSSPAMQPHDQQVSDPDIACRAAGEVLGDDVSTTTTESASSE